jgi:hypothetical protein
VSHPTTRARNDRQKLKKQYAEIREKAQLAGIIATTPEGALKDRNGENKEVVKPSTQSEQRLPQLDAMAARNGWEVPAEKKPVIVDTLTEIASNGETSDKVRVGAARALLAADQAQYERDNPHKSGLAKGASQINQQQNNINVNGFDWMGLIQGISVEELDPLEQRLLSLRESKEDADGENSLQHAGQVIGSGALDDCQKQMS